MSKSINIFIFDFLTGFMLEIRGISFFSGEVLTILVKSSLASFFTVLRQNSRRFFFFNLELKTLSCGSSVCILLH